jgi:hypothetical protein
MFYHNRLNRDWHLLIAWKNVDGKESYQAFKYSSESEKPVFEVDGGGDWDRFFTQLTIMGLVASEPCELSQGDGGPKTPPRELDKSIEGTEEHAERV